MSMDMIDVSGMASGVTVGIDAKQGNPRLLREGDTYPFHELRLKAEAAMPRLEDVTRRSATI